MVSQEVILKQALYRNKEFSQENKHLNYLLTTLGDAINKLGEQPEFSKAHKFLMNEIPTVECP